MVRFLAVAAIVLLIFICVVLLLRYVGVDRTVRERRFAQEQYVKYVRKAQRAGRRNRAEAELYTSMADEYKKKALGAGDEPEAGSDQGT